MIRDNGEVWVVSARKLEVDDVVTEIVCKPVQPLELWPDTSGIQPPHPPDPRVLRAPVGGEPTDLLLIDVGRIATDTSVYFTSDSVARRCTWRFGHVVVRPERLGTFSIAGPGS